MKILSFSIATLLMAGLTEALDLGIPSMNNGNVPDEKLSALLEKDWEALLPDELKGFK